jgi:hypothetical protein
MEAVRILSKYGPGINDEVLKQVLVRFMVMISKGMRFTTIQEVFSGERWEEVTHSAAASTVCWQLGTSLSNAPSLAGAITMIVLGENFTTGLGRCGKVLRKLESIIHVKHWL